MKTLSELTAKSEQYFAEVKLNQKDAQEAYTFILNEADSALKEQDIPTLLSLVSYIENGKGHIAYQYIGKTQRFLRLLHIIEIEYKYQKYLFSDGCDNTNMLIEKYMLTLFSFRRLIFHLSDTSVYEAVCYLQNQPISHFAAYIISHDELMIPNQNFYETIAAIYCNQWSEADIQQFFSLIQQT